MLGWIPEQKEIPLEWFDVDSTGNYSLTFPFEVNLDRREANDWFRRNWFLSVWASLAYIAVIVSGERLMRFKEQAFKLRGALTLWNGFLALFSILGFVRTTPELFRVLSKHGFVHSVCQTTYTQDIVFDFWLVAFVYSKSFELIDTAFIVLRKRPLTFLHCYHHITVFVYCWHGGKELTAAGRWFCWMNYGVHSIMYTYYAFRAQGFRIPKSISITVTSLQLVQMVMGCCIVYTVWNEKSQARAKNLNPDSACHQSWENLYFCCAIYFSYFCLFLRFFINAYVLRPSKVTVEKPAAVVDDEKKAEKEMETNNNNLVQDKYISASEDETKCKLRKRKSKSDVDTRKVKLIIEQYYEDKARKDAFAHSKTHG